MICYRDMTFCTAKCRNPVCDRRLTNDVREDAYQWWGSEGAPIAIQNMSEGCVGFMPKEDEDAKE